MPWFQVGKEETGFTQIDVPSHCGGTHHVILTQILSQFDTFHDWQYIFRAKDRKRPQPVEQTAQLVLYDNLASLKLT